MFVINLSNSKRRLFYLNTQFVTRSEHFISVTKHNQYILYRAKVAVRSEINAKHINTVRDKCTV
jgi:hypothetical protein